MMAIQAIRTGVTEDELLRLGADDQWVEVVNGEIIHMTPVGVLHVWLAGNFYDILRPYAKTNKLGFVFMDGLICVLERSSKGKILTSRVPNICFIRSERIPKGFDLRKLFPGAPDLSIEVISQDETAGSILSKIRDYLKFGSEQVWLMYTNQQELHQHIAGENVVHIYRTSDTLEAPTLFPGLKISIAEVFVLPELDPPTD